MSNNSTKTLPSRINSENAGKKLTNIEGGRNAENNRFRQYFVMENWLLVLVGACVHG